MDSNFRTLFNLDLLTLNLTLFAFNLPVQSKIFKMFREMFDAAVADTPPKTLLHCTQVCI